MIFNNSLALQAKSFVRGHENIHLSKFMKILSLCVSAHKEMMISSHITNDLDEETLSNKLCKAMEDKKGKYGLGLYVFSRESAETDDNTDKTIGYSDIRATIPNPSKYSCGSVYFIMECKLLDSYSDKNKKYINDGINRFIIGKYSPNMNIGGMIGFIKPCNKKRTFPNGKIHYIINDINKKLFNEFKRPKNEEIHNSNSIQCPELFVSHHKRDKNLGNISLYHLMLDVAV